MSRALAAALVLIAHASFQPTPFFTLARECPSVEQPLCNAALTPQPPTPEQLASATPTLALFKLLIENQSRQDDAMAMFERLLSSDLDTAIGALELLSNRGFAFRNNDTKDYGPRILTAIAPLTKQISALRREDAARLAWAVKRIDLEFQEPRVNSWEPAQREFIATYPDTEAARLMQVDLLGSLQRAPILQVIDDLERYGRAHPASVDGAKAMWMAAFQLGSNLQIGAHFPRGFDPTEYALRTIKIVADLEHGKYPKSHWTDDAPALVSQFFISSMDEQPNFAPGNLERLIAGYQSFVNSHFNSSGPEDPIDSNTGYVITGRMLQLYKWLNVTDGLDRVLTAVEESGADRVAVAQFRAEYAVRQAMANPAKYSEAKAMLDALAAASTEYPARKALATLLSLAATEGDDATVVSAAERYLTLYPGSPAAWVAALRLGQAHERAGSMQRALDDYQRAAGLAALPFARITAAVYEARVHERRSEFEAALDAYRGAVDAWRPDAIQRINSEVRMRSGAIAPGAFGPATSFTRDELATRIRSLERFGSIAGGELLLKAERLIEQRDYAGAEASAREFLRTRANTANTASARELLHTAQLEDALAIGVRNSNDPAFLSALTSLGGEPFDGPVAVSRLAKAMLLDRQGDHDGAATLASSTLDAWRAATMLPESRDAALDRDIASVLETITNYVTSQAMHDSYGKPPIAVSPSSRRVLFGDIQLRLAGTPASSPHALAMLPQSWTNVVIVRRQDTELMMRAAYAIAGRKPTSEQPLTAFWMRYFPAPSNSWRGWAMETYPLVREIEFLDADLNTAAARVNVDAGSGFTAILERRGTGWTVVRITSQWIA